MDMSRANESTSDRCAQVVTLLADHALEVLDPHEALGVAEHLAFCAPCLAVFRRVRAEVAVLTEVVPSEAPPPDLWTRVRARVASTRDELAAEAAKATAAHLPQGSLLLRAAGGGWADTSVPGVRVRKLHEDAAEDRRTALYQMDPGASYPAHVHGGVEECYVLSGDLQVGELSMGPGDYQRVEGGSRHSVQSTRNGCLLLITCSMSDEMD